MPHFIIECSENTLTLEDPKEIIDSVYEVAMDSGLFAKSGTGGIKVRINSYKHYTTVGNDDDFLHVFANIMEGRTQIQKKKLSDSIVRKLKSMFPSIPIISINIRDFEKSTYSNKNEV